MQILMMMRSVTNLIRHATVVCWWFIGHLQNLISAWRIILRTERQVSDFCLLSLMLSDETYQRSTCLRYAGGKARRFCFKMNYFFLKTQKHEMSSEQLESTHRHQRPRLVGRESMHDWEKTTKTPDKTKPSAVPPHRSCLENLELCFVWNDTSFALMRDQAAPSALPEIFSHTGSKLNHTEQIRLVRFY